MKYSIADVAKKFEINSSTLRYYEEMGLIKDVKRNSSGYREYTNDHIGKLEAIGCFKRAGMSISEIQSFFKYEDDIDDNIDDMIALLENRREKMLDDFKELFDAYSHILRKLDYYGEMDMAVKEKRDKPKWSDYDKREYTKVTENDIMEKCRK